MPVTKTAAKELRKSKKRRVVNETYKKNMKVAVGVFLKKATKGDALTQKDVASVYEKIDKAQKKNLLHKKAAARKKSRIAKKFNLLAKGK